MTDYEAQLRDDIEDFKAEIQCALENIAAGVEVEGWEKVKRAAERCLKIAEAKLAAEVELRR